MKLSVIIIAKNAQDQIKDAIASAKNIAGEVVVIDNGSTDKTQSIAEKLGAKVFPIESNSFAQLRNFGLEKAAGEWILYIDSDERVTAELAASVKDHLLKAEESVFSAFKVKRKNFYLGKHEWPYVEKLERLFRKDRLERWYGDLHESPVVVGEVGELAGFLLHFTHRDLFSMLAKTIEWSKMEAQFRLQAGHPKMTWWRFPRVMLRAFLDSYIHQEGYRVGTAGLIESIYQAFSMFITYGRLWEMQQKEKERT